ncbi:MAG: hypothetical protein M3Z04_21310 [Chloroflexota bacterium]|nr:hypothetical protein [Chloroflexota bacterium]
MGATGHEWGHEYTNGWGRWERGVYPAGAVSIRRAVARRSPSSGMRNGSDRPRIHEWRGPLGAWGVPGGGRVYPSRCGPPVAVYSCIRGPIRGRSVECGMRRGRGGGRQGTGDRLYPPVRGA